MYFEPKYIELYVCICVFMFDKDILKEFASDIFERCFDYCVVCERFF